MAEVEVLVEKVREGRDGRVRSAKVGYRLPKEGRKPEVYDKKHSGVWESVTRGVQRLSLLLPVEEQGGPLEVEGIVVKPKQGLDGQKE